jgi:hypothetical protein
LYFSRSASVVALTWTTSAVIVPLVDGEYQRGIPIIGADECSVIMCAENRSMVQPWPNGNRSMCTFCSPHSLNFAITQSAPFW